MLSIISISGFNGAKYYFEVLAESHGSLPIFMPQFHCLRTGVWKIYDTGPKVIYNGDFNGAIKHF